MNEIEPQRNVPAVFANEEFRLDIIPEGDSFRVAAPGLARALGHRDAYRLVESLPEDEKEKGYTLSCTPGDHEVWFVTEPGFYRAIGQRQAARVRDAGVREQVTRFQSWVYREVLPTLRKTGRYEVQPAKPLDPLERLRRSHEELGEALAIADAERQRADTLAAEAESLRDKAKVADAITEAMGMTPKEFRRAYFPDVAQNRFFDHVYAKGYLIDQRGTRRGENGEPKDGYEHGHPGWRGNAFFYLHSPWIDENGRRRGRARVRPGQNELDLVAQLERDGLTSNRAYIPQPRQLTGTTPLAIAPVPVTEPVEEPVRAPVDFMQFQRRSA